MQRLPADELREALTATQNGEEMDNKTALRLKKRLAEEFREQLTVGIPTNEAEASLRRLAGQLRARKVIVKLFLRHCLHAKLYLLFRRDPNSPIVGYLGSSNLTFAGLAGQGELNVDVLDSDACAKLKQWFEDRWEDRWCVDISDELVRIIEESWAREELIPPYHIYVKMAYHLSQEARAGLSEFRMRAKTTNSPMSPWGASCLWKETGGACRLHPFASADLRRLHSGAGVEGRSQARPSPQGARRCHGIRGDRSTGRGREAHVTPQLGTKPVE